jgi:hypothetical protein
MNTIKWNRPTKSKTGNLVYTSKDGRFTITRRYYIAPSASVGYILEGVGVAKYSRDNDTLKGAKEAAEDSI